MAATAPRARVELTPGEDLWQRCFIVTPLVVIGTNDPDGRPNLAPKHLAMPLSWERAYGFVCHPSHATYRNARRDGWFTVSYVDAARSVFASLAASPRVLGRKHAIDALPTEPAARFPGVLLAGAYLHLECRLDRVVDDLDHNVLLVGRVERASAAAEALREPDVDDAELLARSPLLAYLHPGRLAHIERTAAFPFPRGFSREP